MALGLQIAPAGSGGDFTPIIMYAAREGRFYLRDRVQGSTGAFENEDTELPAGTKMVFDYGLHRSGGPRLRRSHASSGHGGWYDRANAGADLPSQRFHTR